MQTALARAFLLLLIAQAAHSVEEIAGRLHEVFAPARFVSGLVGPDLATGFAAINAAIVAFGLWCWAVPIRRSWPSTAAIAWGWALIEIANGTSHMIVAVWRGGYFPGVLTAPLLIGGGAWLASVLRRGGAPF